MKMDKHTLKPFGVSDDCDCWRKPKLPRETHADIERTCTFLYRTDPLLPLLLTFQTFDLSRKNSLVAAWEPLLAYSKKNLGSIPRFSGAGHLCFMIFLCLQWLLPKAQVCSHSPKTSKWEFHRHVYDSLN